MQKSGGAMPPGPPGVAGPEKKILVSEKELGDINFERLKNALIYIKNILIDSDDNMYLTVDPLIGIKNIITGSKNIILGKVNVK